MEPERITKSGGFDRREPGPPQSARLASTAQTTDGLRPEAAQDHPPNTRGRSVFQRPEAGPSLAAAPILAKDTSETDPWSFAITRTARRLITTTRYTMSANVRIHPSVEAKPTPSDPYDESIYALVKPAPTVPAMYRSKFAQSVRADLKASRTPTKPAGGSRVPMQGLGKVMSPLNSSHGSASDMMPGRKGSPTAPVNAAHPSQGTVPCSSTGLYFATGRSQPTAPTKTVRGRKGKKASLRQPVPTRLEMLDVGADDDIIGSASDEAHDGRERGSAIRSKPGAVRKTTPATTRSLAGQPPAPKHELAGTISVNERGEKLVLLTEQERLQKLSELQAFHSQLERDYSRMPIVVDTFSQKRRKQKLEDDLRQVESMISKMSHKSVIEAR
ncbi:uncharacterized protein BJ171DRAFT_28249 [Polychytrium aggregatum]|uniref:uncharacterized protein n=1 Tax=Polychytrium aggregatum TaxID=110093 RepID=UPI0022FED9B0|nr:uncharacterized protein BJ171DRAFT_28249 [Polychytrium aggregatum]KAI9206316.1 hypothetical protein BJ171DRAFT_28249 [Polychytrium aggregatum]